MTVPQMTKEELVLSQFVRGQNLSNELAYCSEARLTSEAINHKILYPLASYLFSTEGIGDSWRLWALKRILISERDEALCAQATQKTICILESKNISPVLIKGASLGFGKPRDAGDVDLLIRESSLIEAIACLEAMGYLYRGFERNIHIRHREHRNWKNLLKWSNQFEFTEPESGVLVELHTSLFETGRIYEERLSDLRANIGYFFSSAIVDTKTGYTFLSIEDRVLLLALHCGLKRSPSRKCFILRHVLDFRNLLEIGFDWELLEKRAFFFNVAHHVLFLLYLYDSFALDVSVRSYMHRFESRISWVMVKLQNLHKSCLIDVGSYNRNAILAYRIVGPFIYHGTFMARIRSLLIFPLLFPEPYALAEVYGLPNRSRLVYLCYLIEPLRMLYRVAVKVMRKTRLQNCTRLPSFFARDNAIRSMQIPDGKAKNEKVAR
jgi:hypothetical protein